MALLLISATEATRTPRFLVTIRNGASSFFKEGSFATPAEAGAWAFDYARKTGITIERAAMPLERVPGSRRADEGDCGERIMVQDWRLPESITRALGLGCSGASLTTMDHQKWFALLAIERGALLITGGKLVATDFLPGGAL